MASDQYRWLYDLGPAAPNFIEEALKLRGTVEGPGDENNPTIIAWARECDLDRLYGRNDSVPWCGLFAAVVVRRAKYEPVANPLWALNWSNFGQPAPQPGLGDLMVWRRSGGGHVNFYVGEDDTHWHCIGGNQHDAVNIARFERHGALQLVHVRRPKWKIGQPETVRPYRLRAEGTLGGKVT